MYMRTKINEHLVKISAGYIPIAKPLEMDQDYQLIVEGQVVKTEDKSNNDGSVNRVYTIKGIIVEEEL